MESIEFEWFWFDDIPQLLEDHCKQEERQEELDTMITNSTDYLLEPLW